MDGQFQRHGRSKVYSSRNVPQGYDFSAANRNAKNNYDFYDFRRDGIYHMGSYDDSGNQEALSRTCPERQRNYANTSTGLSQDGRHLYSVRSKSQNGCHDSLGLEKMTPGYQNGNQKYQMGYNYDQMSYTSGIQDGRQYSKADVNYSDNAKLSGQSDSESNYNQYHTERFDSNSHIQRPMDVSGEFSKANSVFYKNEAAEYYMPGCNSDQDLQKHRERLLQMNYEIDTLDREILSTHGEIPNSREINTLDCERLSTYNEIPDNCDIDTLSQEIRSTHSEIQSSQGGIRSTQGEIWINQGELRSTQGEIWINQGEIQNTQGETWSTHGKIPNNYEISSLNQEKMAIHGEKPKNYEIETLDRELLGTHNEKSDNCNGSEFTEYLNQNLSSTKEVPQEVEGFSIRPSGVFSSHLDMKNCSSQTKNSHLNSLNGSHSVSSSYTHSSHENCEKVSRDKLVAMRKLHYSGATDHGFISEDSRNSKENGCGTFLLGNSARLSNSTYNNSLLSLGKGSNLETTGNSYDKDLIGKKVNSKSDNSAVISSSRPGQTRLLGNVAKSFSMGQSSRSSISSEGLNHSSSRSMSRSQQNGNRNNKVQDNICMNKKQTCAKVNPKQSNLYYSPGALEIEELLSESDKNKMADREGADSVAIPDMDVEPELSFSDSSDSGEDVNTLLNRSQELKSLILVSHNETRSYQPLSPTGRDIVHSPRRVVSPPRSYNPRGRHRRSHSRERVIGQFDLDNSRLTVTSIKTTTFEDSYAVPCETDYPKVRGLILYKLNNSVLLVANLANTN